VIISSALQEEERCMLRACLKKAWLLMLQAPLGWSSSLKISPMMLTAGMISRESPSSSLRWDANFNPLWDSWMLSSAELICKSLCPLRFLVVAGCPRVGLVGTVQGSVHSSLCLHSSFQLPLCLLSSVQLLLCVTAAFTARHATKQESVFNRHYVLWQNPAHAC